MRAIAYILTSLMLTIFSIGCSEDIDTTIDSTKWQLKGYVTDSNSNNIRRLSASNTDEVYTLEFINKFEFYVWGNTNSMGGQYKIIESEITISEQVSTCTNSKYRYDEKLYFEMLKNSKKYGIQNNELYLYTNNDGGYLIFTKL